MSKLRLLKEGSDPEALFHNAEGRAVSATTFVGNRQAGYSSWVGTDGHAFTAELRPLPFNNVFRHARNIAEAICVIDDAALKKHDAFMVAQPYVEGPGEPLGGHIHVSFVLRDPVSVPAIAAGYVFDVSGVSTTRVSPEGGVRLTQERLVLDRSVVKYIDARNNGEPVFGLHTLKNRLNHFIQPLEAGLYPTRRRNSRSYGSGGDIIRYDHANPKILNATTLKWRVEYRFPSTWLCHPALALTYLAAAKLAINNHHLPPDPYSVIEPLSIGHGNMATLLQSRLDYALKHEDAVVTDDTACLPKLLRYVTQVLYPKLQEALVRVDTEAWREFYEQGRWK